MQVCWLRAATLARCPTRWCHTSAPTRRRKRIWRLHERRRLAMTAAYDRSLSLETLRDPRVRANPYPFYARLRSEAPLHWDAAAGMDGGWVLTRHADVMAALRDPHVTAERLEPPQGTDWLPEEYQAAARQVFRAMPHQLLFLDPP